MKKLFVFIFSIVALFGCEEEGQLGQTPMDSVPPGKVSNVRVENSYGAAVIKYDIPTDNDLLYVKATYKINETIEREIMSSFYSTELKIDGFGEEKDYSVRLVSVDRSRNESEPVEVTVSPLTPPVDLVFNSLKVAPDFGGINLKWENELEKEINIFILVNDTLNPGNFIEEEIIYTSTIHGDRSVRGFASEPRQFQVYMSDRWGNKSELFSGELTPMFEQELDKSLFEYLFSLTPDDVGYLWHPDNLWNNNYSAGPKGTFISAWPPVRTIKEGLYFTMDLGKKSKISRMKLWQRPHKNLNFNHLNVKRFKLWGSNAPSKDPESFDGWSDMGEYSIIKPSGLPLGQLSNEDNQAVADGHEALIPLEVEAYRYIRFQVLETWLGGDLLQIAELAFWGQYFDE